MASLLDEILRRRRGAAGALLTGDQPRENLGMGGAGAASAGQGMLPKATLGQLAQRVRPAPPAGPAPEPQGLLTPTVPAPGPAPDGPPAPDPRSARRTAFGNVAIGLVDSLDLPEEGRAVLRQDVQRTLDEPTAGEENEGILSRIAGGLAGLDNIPGADQLSNEQKKGFLSNMLVTAGLIGLGGNATLWEGLLVGRMMVREEAAQTAGALLDERASQQFWGRINSLAPLPEDGTHEDVIENLRKKQQMAVEAAGRGIAGATGAADMFKEQIQDVRDAHKSGLDRAAEVAAREDIQVFQRGEEERARGFEREEGQRAREFERSERVAGQRFDQEMAERERRAQEASEELDLSEAEAKSLSFASRGTQANSILNSVENPTITRALPNFLQPADTQRFEQASRMFAEAVLRKDSGAAISDGEFDRVAETYLPQVGDSQEVLKQKRRARKNFLQSVAAPLPEAARQRIGSINAGLGAASSAGGGRQRSLTDDEIRSKWGGTS